MSNEQVKKWDACELSFDGPRDGNPFVDVEFYTFFRNGNREIRATGFYDGDGIYRVRFMPDTEGEWSYRTSSNVAQLDGKTGGVVCTGAEDGSHGPVRVRNGHHFAYADGKPYFPFGTTCYAWTHQEEAMQEQTLASLKRTRFNKVRMGVFPKHYIYSENEPLHPMFEQRADGTPDFSRPNVVAFRQFDKQIRALMAMGIEADVIIFHPYDRWHYCDMSFEEDVRYVKYLVARLAAYRNVWWSLANEYDFLLDVKPIEQWDRYFHVIEEHDPNRHLMSIHNGEVSMKFDYRKPWISHVCVQDWDVKQTDKWRHEWGKPVINDEPEYEGNIPRPWGNLSARELVHRFWITVTRGGYAGHGETYMHPDDLLWWAKGGELRGESPARIGFLRDILEADVVSGLTPLSDENAWEWHRVSGGRDGDYRLIYFGEHQPMQWAVGLPKEDGDWEIDLIDTWEMTVTPLEKMPLPVSPALRQRGGAIVGAEPEAAFGIQLPGKPYQAVRVRRRRT
ncbi:DUF5060 domain-containing protein [Burkholderia pyrrocinia]|uniref:DUF5060 domain-containing protein n=1 Tax=Burkholderia pyrrocinia TaxID=60550 RepID=UPI002AAF9239|nr:DUF5060 domain-containing protein [Burkholderia pyrrocinia]